MIARETAPLYGCSSNWNVVWARPSGRLVKVPFDCATEKQSAVIPAATGSRLRRSGSLSSRRPSNFVLIHVCTVRIGRE
jgi:hypothetical protein